MARWVAGVDIEGKPHPDSPFPIEQTEWAGAHDPHDVAEFAALVRAKAKNLIALMSDGDNRTFDSFISGSQQALSVFAFGRLAPAMGRSTFRMSDLKECDKPTTLFIVADASRMEAYKAFVGLVQWCCMTAVKRHENKERPIFYIFRRSHKLQSKRIGKPAYLGQIVWPALASDLSGFSGIRAHLR